MRRVVVTGMGALTPVGNDWPSIEAHLRSLRNGVSYMAGWEIYEGLRCRLAAVVPEFPLPAHYNRQRTRGMGRVSLLATYASELALADAGLLGNPVLTGGRAGVAYGSSSGSPPSIIEFGEMLINHRTGSMRANTYVRMMPHTTAVSIGIFFGMTGRIIPSSSACTSGSLSIGYAYESIQRGLQDVILAGGAEEISPSQAAVFETLYATSERNDDIGATPRPFDRNRDGLVIGEGAATLVLEELDHAQARGARILAEIVGFGTNSDGRHVTQPAQETMATCLRLALADANLAPEAIGYINAHGTATEAGDIAESNATADVFGRHITISSLKSYTGHTLGACGAIEAVAAIQMMRNGWFAPNLNLDDLDPRCAPLDYITGAGRAIDTDLVMSNNFAFGGVNSSLIFRRWT